MRGRETPWWNWGEKGKLWNEKNATHFWPQVFHNKATVGSALKRRIGCTRQRSCVTKSRREKQIVTPKTRKNARYFEPQVQNDEATIWSAFKRRMGCERQRNSLTNSRREQQMVGREECEILLDHILHNEAKIASALKRRMWWKRQRNCVTKSGLREIQLARREECDVLSDHKHSAMKPRRKRL